MLELGRSAGAGSAGAGVAGRRTGVLALFWWALLMGALGVALWQAATGAGVQQAVQVGRTVADIAENIGRWASKYGGVHVRTIGANAALPGNFLTRSLYAESGSDAGMLGGTRTMAEARVSEREAMARLEAYHWKNPALIQREVADVIGESGSKVRYRMTARTVLNPNNAPNEFELEAMGHLEAAFARATAESGDSTSARVSGAGEYWTVRAGRLHYARAVVAQASCLKCHDTLEKAPEFLKTNTQFNGGGGFGYVAGRPVGVISVTVPMPSPQQAWLDSVDAEDWAAWGLAVLAALGLLAQLLRRRA